VIPVPAEWPTIASGTHAPRWRARIAEPDGTVVADDLPITGGQIERDEEGGLRTRANVDIPTTAIPSLLDQVYLPTGRRLQLQYTIGDGAWVTMADVDMVASAIARPDDMWTISATDRSARIALDDLSRGTIPVFGGDTVENTVRAIVHRTFPGTTVTATGPATTQLVPAKYGGESTDGSPWQVAEALAGEAQSEVFYTYDRQVRIRPVPGIGTPVDTLTVGESGQLTGYVVQHEMAFNSVAYHYVSNTTNNTLVIGRWTDTRADSPVAVQRVGSEVVVGFVAKVDQAPSQAEADAAAAAWAKRAAGRARSAELRHPTRPWLEPGDSVDVTFLGGPTETQVVKSVGIDLGPDNIQVTRLRNDDYKMGDLVP